METRGRRRLWLKAQISSLDLGSVQESCTHTHTHTHSAKAVTAALTRATALIYGLFDLHDNPSAPIHSLAGPAVAAINTGWTRRPTLSQPHKHICSPDLLSLTGLALHPGLLLLLEACLRWR